MPGYGKYGGVSESIFIDREKELEELKEHLGSSINGDGRLVFVFGEAGIGKTRLIKELMAFAESKDVMTLKGRCLHQENAEPYLPFIDAFGEYLTWRQHPDMERGERENKASDEFYSMGIVGISGLHTDSENSSHNPYSISKESVSLGLLPMDEEDSDASSERIEKINLQQERARLFESLSQLVIDISNRNPLLLVLDDLEWADDGSLQLLHYIARNIQNSRIMICGAYTVEEIEVMRSGLHPLAKTLRRMRPEKLFYEIRLHRFDANSTGRMIESLLKRQDIPDALTDRLYERCQGNPFFVEEVVKSLVNEGLIDLDDYTWETRFDPSRIHIPSTIRDVIWRRIDKLDTTTKPILRFASVIGNQFTFDLLHRISEMDEERLVDSLDALIASNIIREDLSSQEERYRFDHPEIREVIYVGLSRSRRRLMHKKIGYVLEDMYRKRTDEVVYGLAHHFYEGREAEKTITYAIKAGEKSTMKFAPEDALSYYNMALNALDRLEATRENKEKKMDMLNRLGDINFNLSEWNAALEYYNKSIRLGEEISNQVNTSEALRKSGFVLNRMGTWTLATEHFEKSLEISKKIDDWYGIADAHRGLGYIHWRTGEYEKAIAHYKECIDVSTDIGEMHTIAIAFIELGNVFIETGDLERAIDYYNKSLKALEPMGDYAEMARAYNNLGDSHLKSGNYDEAIEYFKNCEITGKKIGRKDIVGWSLFNSGEAYALKGDADKAMDCAERSLDILKTVGDNLGIQNCYKIFGMAYGLREEWNKAIESFETCIKLGEETKVPYVQGEVYYYFGRMYKNKGDNALAKEQFSKALDIFKGLETGEFVARVEKEIEAL